MISRSLLPIARAWLALGLLAVIGAAAQASPEIRIQRVDVSGLPRVVVDLTVTDGAGRSVLGLTPRELGVAVDGVAQPGASLSSVLASDQALAVVMLFDRSGSMASDLEKARNAALDFLERLSDRDRVAVIAFDDVVRLEAPLSSERAETRRAIEGLTLGRDTALWDALTRGIELLSSADTSRRALVVMSDGKDTRSSMRPDQVLERTRSEGIPIYAVGLESQTVGEDLERLTTTTGGAFLEAASPGDFLRLYQSLAERLQNQYRLTFESTFGADQAWHDLEIALGPSDLGEARASRDFLATTGPGLSRARLDELRRSQQLAPTALAAAVGGALGLLLGLGIAVALSIGTRSLDGGRLIVAGLVVSSALLGSLLGALWSLYG